MSDLIETLIAIACQHGGEELYKSRIEWKAAKEIERRTAERDTAEAILEQLQNKFAAVTADNEMLRDELEQQYARVEKLEAALEEIGTSPFTDEHARIIARAATEQGESDE
jgi:uncharacterized protein with von Willebrand factor type A (vWA) domain